MVKKWIYIIFLPLLLSCVTDEKMVGKDNGGDGPEPPEPVALIYNEPLLLFGESLNNIKSMETRQYISETDDRLFYNDSKGSVNYQIAYYFSNDKMINVFVTFDYSQEILTSIFEGLSYKYELITESPMVFLNPDNLKNIKVESSSQENYIRINYLN